jgi:hypothetical protein
MGLNDMFGNGQTKTGAPLATTPGLINPVKTLKQTGHMFPCNTATPIPNPDFNYILLEFRFNPHPTLPHAVFNSVVN